MSAIDRFDVSRPLSDEQRLRFLTDGYLALQAETVSAEQHRLLYERADDLYAAGQAIESKTTHLDILGDNLRAQIPEIDLILGDPLIDGALTSLLGPDYLLHPHSYCHRSSSRDQVFHQDGNLPWNQRGHYRSHRPDWAMLFYYPQPVDQRNGPTEVVAGSQYWTIDHEKDDGTWYPGDRVDRAMEDFVFGSDDLALRDRQQAEALERGLAVPDLDRRFVHVSAGTVLIAHYDLFHRGSRVEGATVPRYMYKFYFARVHEPVLVVAPSSGGHDLGDTGRSGPIVEAQTAWLTGRPQSAALARHGLLEDAIGDLDDGREDEKVAAAYLLGRSSLAGDRRAREALEAGLVAEQESTRRAAGNGLRQAGAAGVVPLLRAVASPAAPTRRVAVAGLGTAVAADHPEVVPALVAALGHDGDDLVRSNAAYSLGQLSRADTVDPVDAAGIADALLDRIAPGAEPDNAFEAGFSRSTVRQSAAFALTLLLANHRLSDDCISEVVARLRAEPDRYVQGLLVEGLARAEHVPADARRSLLRFLSGRRWNAPAGASTPSAP